MYMQVAHDHLYDKCFYQTDLNASELRLDYIDFLCPLGFLPSDDREEQFMAWNPWHSFRTSLPENKPGSSSFGRIRNTAMSQCFTY